MRRLMGLALVAIMMACGFTARAEETEYDPAKVSESLKAIFQFGSAATKQSLNANTVTLISGTIGGTPCVVNGMMDALAELGIKNLATPLTPMKVWQAIRDARAAVV